MPKQWSKVRRDAMVSTRIAKLAREHPLAFGIYWVLKAEADDFGRFTADPEKFAVKCGGLAHLTAEEATEIMQAMKACGVIRVYKVNGERYLEIAEYMKHEHDGEPKWHYVGRAEFPPPPDWTPPAGLIAFLQANGHKRNVTPARYGIEPGINAACDQILRALGVLETEPQPNPSPTQVEAQLNHTSTVVQPQLNGASNDVDVDVDDDVDDDGDYDCDGDNDSPRGRAGGNGDLPRSEDYPPRPKRLGETGDLPILKTEFGNLWAACKGLPWAEVRERWLQDVAAAVKSPGDTWLTSDKQAADLLVEYAPKGDEKYLPSKWLSRVEEIVAPKPRKGSVSEYAQKRSVAGPKPGVSGTGWDLLDKILEEE